MDIIYLVLTLLAVGVLSGLSAGMFGVGGGAVMVPAPWIGSCYGRQTGCKAMRSGLA